MSKLKTKKFGPPQKVELSYLELFYLKENLTLAFLCNLWAFSNKNLQYLREKVLSEKILLHKKSQKKFLQHFRWSKKFLIFFAFSFFCNTLYILNFFWPLLSLLLHTFWVTSQSDHKSGPQDYFLGGGHNGHPRVTSNIFQPV